MAAVQQSAVAILDSYTMGGTSAKRRTVVEATVALVAQGGAVNNVPVSLFGLRICTDAKIMTCVTSGGTEYATFVQVDKTGTFLLFGNYAAGALTFPSDVAIATPKLRLEGYQ